jgi:GAF domain-containing protein
VEAGIDMAEMARKAVRLADEQAALRRVATLVASSAQPEQVFQIVAEEAGRLLEARTAATVRFDEDSAVVVGSWSDGEGAGIEVGTLVPYSDPGSPVYRATHEGGRVDDYAELAGEAARLTRLRGYRSAVMAPITAGGRLWGTLAVFSASANHFPADAEQRLADYTNLVALALESAEAHDQLTASRARIVEAWLSAEDSNAICTTVPSSGSSPSPCTCESPRKPCARIRPPRRQCSRASART